MPYRLAMWISLAAVFVLATVMMRFRTVAEAGFLLLFIPLLWACFAAPRRHLVVMVFLVAISRVVLEYIRLAGPHWEFHIARLTISSLAPILLYIALALAFLFYRRRTRMMQDQLIARERSQAVSQFVGGLAHDLNNILSVILGTSHIMQREPDVPASVQADAQTIADAAQRGSTLIRRMLQQRPDSETQKEPLDLSTIAQEAVRYVKPALGPQMEVQVENDGQPLPVLANTLQMYQVILNLCINAADAMDHQGTIHLRTCRVEIQPGQARAHARPGGAYGVLEVVDTGKGMGAKDLARLFEPFFTTKSAQEGTGLGLVVVKSILDDHGGFIEYDSALGQGTTARIHLPLCPEGGPGRAPAPTREAATG